MNETSNFTIHSHETHQPHFDLTIRANGDTKSWVIPSCIPKVERDKNIAVEQPNQTTVHIEQIPSLVEDSYGSGIRTLLDKGTIEIELLTKAKLVFTARGEVLKGRFIIHQPGWGRHTKKKLWLLEKIPGLSEVIIQDFHHSSDAQTIWA